MSVFHVKIGEAYPCAIVRVRLEEVVEKSTELTTEETKKCPGDVAHMIEENAISEELATCSSEEKKTIAIMVELRIGGKSLGRSSNALGVLGAHNEGHTIHVNVLKEKTSGAKYEISEIHGVASE